MKAALGSAAVALGVAAAAGCASWRGATDRLPGPAVRAWLEPGPQTLPTPAIEEAARALRGRPTRRARVRAAIDLLQRRFDYDFRYNVMLGERTAGEIFRTRTMGDCSDYATAAAALLREAGVPALVVFAASADWVRDVRADPSAMPRGHALVAVYLEDGWHLANPSWARLHGRYDPAAPALPGGYLFCRQGRDGWSVGLRNADDVRAMLAARARDPGPGWERRAFERPVPLSTRPRSSP